MQKKLNNMFNISMIISTILMLMFTFYLFKNGILTNPPKMHHFISSFGLIAPLVFIMIQIISIIFPIIPGGFTTVLGVICFGPLNGFIYNYISIVIGSILVFLISKRYGVGIVQTIIGQKMYDKYADWLDKDEKFSKAFTIAIFLPIAPDDILCYFAGLTKMSLVNFSLIILVGKPLSILAYSLGIYHLLLGFITKF